MKKATTGYLFPLFALFVIFSDELFFSFISFIGADLESGMKAREAIVIAGIGYLLMGLDFFNKKFKTRNYYQFFGLLIILVSYYVAGQTHPHTDIYDRYWSTFLSFGALCIPSCYIGMRLAREHYDDQVLRFLPFFLIVVSVVVGSAVLFKSMSGSLLQKEEDVFSYQTSSYYLAFCFSYCMFYVFFNKKEKQSLYDKTIALAMFATMFLCAVGTLLGGGRGAFVYLVLITVFLVYRIMKKGKGGVKIKYFIILAVVAIIMIFLANKLNILESSGVNRLIERLNTESDDVRMQSWHDALGAFYKSPVIGHGIGSVWWTVGFYSHNMLADLLAETGIVGTVIVISLIIKIFKRQSLLSYNSSFDMFLLLLFMGAMVHDTFSGYWISSPKLFLLYGYVFASRNTNKQISINSVK